MSSKFFNRPTSTYTGESGLANRTKYQDDSAAVPKIKISSVKLDGDINYLVDAVNTLYDTAVGGTIPDGSVTNAKIRASSALSVIGRSSNTSGSVADIVASNDGQVLVRSGSSLAFGQLASGSYGTASIPTAAYQDASITQTKLAADVLPAGMLIPFAGSVTPTGWLLCAGQAVSRTTYSALFAAIATTYGAGDGSTTFNLPDLRGRAVAGVDNMGGTAANRITNATSGITGTTLGAAGGDERVQSHTHTATVTDPGHQHDTAMITGSPDPNAIYGLTGSTHAGKTPAGNSTNFGMLTQNTVTGISVTNSTFGAGSSQNVQPTIMLNYIIKT